MNYNLPQYSNPVTASLRRPALWLIFAAYIALLTISIMYHELWNDEMQAWNIAKGSNSFFDLLQNRQFEGHPPVWHTILWIISKWTHDPVAVKIAQWIIAVAVVFVVLFLSPFPFTAKLLLPFGYFFLFEYGVISRNYAIAVLAAFLVCFIMYRQSRYRQLVYYILLFVLLNTHMLAVPLAAVLHLYFLQVQATAQQSKKILFMHALLGIIAALPALYLIYPPADGATNIHFWVKKTKMEYATIFIKSPLWSFIPVPEWWKYRFWNTECFITINSGIVRKFIAPILSILIVAGAFYTLKRNKKSVLLFALFLLLTAIVAIFFFGLTASRYTGFIYIAFLCAWWLCCYHNATVVGVNKWFINILLLIQVIAAFIAVGKDIRYPFSNAYRMNELLRNVPAGNMVVTDYFALTTVNTYASNKYYCVDLKKQADFISWGTDMKLILGDSSRYVHGFDILFRKNAGKKIFMISTADPAGIQKADKYFFNTYRATINKAIDGAIERGNDIYLYEVSPLH